MVNTIETLSSAYSSVEMVVPAVADLSRVVAETVSKEARVKDVRVRPPLLCLFSRFKTFSGSVCAVDLLTRLSTCVMRFDCPTARFQALSCASVLTL